MAFVDKCLEHLRCELHEGKSTKVALIPTIDGRMPKQASKPLTSLEHDGSFVVHSVADQDAILLKRLKAHGITPGTRIKVTKRSPQEFSLSQAAPYGFCVSLVPLQKQSASALRSRDGTTIDKGSIRTV